MKLHIVVLVLAAESAVAQPTDDIEDAPPPGAESGRVDTPRDEDSAARVVARTVLLVPRTLFEAVVVPVRAAIVANERYHLAGWAREVFFSDSGALGVYPFIQFESADGFLIGAKLDAWLGYNERLKIFAGAGLESRRRFQGQFRSSGLIDGVAIGIHAEYIRTPESRFYGFGNNNEVDTPPPMPIDPFVDMTAFKTYYNSRHARIAALVDIDVVGSVRAVLSGALADRERAVGNDGPPIDQVYMPSSLISFDDYRTGYAELDLRYDTRGPHSAWQPPMITSRGSLLSVYGGRQTLDPGPAFWRYGMNAQHYQRIGAGPRVVSARFHGEAVSAELDEVPFNELPYLGGPMWLRGYASERFRDRVAAVGTVEYTWDLSRLVFASVFVDAGRVYAGLDDLTLDGLRWGYGLALEGHSDTSLAARISIASSSDGGVYVNLYLDPVSYVEPRVRRK
jgi:hypothetical protein